MIVHGQDLHRQMPESAIEETCLAAIRREGEFLDGVQRVHQGIERLSVVHHCRPVGSCRLESTEQAAATQRQ